jgi:autotransporter-associated beta strand protein
VVFLGLLSLAVPGYGGLVYKADDTDNLNLGSSWTNGVTPTAADVAVWDSTVTAARTNALGVDTNWGGVQIINPNGAVTVGANVNTAGLIVTSGNATLTYSNAPGVPLVNDSRAILSGTSAPGGLAFGVFYYVVNATATTFQLSATQGGAAITPTTVGTNTFVTGPVLTLGSSGIDTTLGSQPVTFTCPVIVGTPQNFSLASGVTINAGLYGANNVTLQSSSGATLTIGGLGMALSNLVVTSGATVSISAGGPGIVALNGGIFSVNGAINEGINVTAGGGTEQNTGGNRTWSGPLTGSGPLTVIASATHTWSGNNTNYTGTITLQGSGTLRLNSTNSVSASTAYNFSTGNMSANQTGLFNLGSLAGSGSLFGGTNQNYSIGALGTDTEFSGAIGGGMSLFKVGAGTLTLSGANTYTGGTTISNGVVQVGNGGSSGSLGIGRVTNYATLSFNRGDAAFSFTNPIVGTGLVRQDGPGTTLLTGPGGSAGANTYTGGTFLNVGTLSIATGALGSGGLTFNGGGLQWGAGTTTDISSQTVTFSSGGATLDVNGNSVVLANAIGNNGTGGLIVKSTSGSGSLSLQGANIYSGVTTVSSGALKVNNSTGSATGTGSVLVNTGTLTGTGTISGLVDVAFNGTLAPGNSVGTMTVGSLTLESGAICNFEFNSTPANDKVIVTSAGGLTLNGGVFNLFGENTVIPWTTPGTYQLIQYSGSTPSLDSTWTTDSPSNPHIGNPQVGFSYMFAASGGFLTVKITHLLSSIVGVWNVDANGNWSDSSKWLSNSVPHVAGDSANFGVGSALRNVTLDVNETVSGITFSNAHSFVISAAGKTLSLTNSGSPVPVSVVDGLANAIQTTVALNDEVAVTVAGGKSLSISGALTSASGKGLILGGAGTLALSGNNSYGPGGGSVGTTLTDGGTLQVGANAALSTGDVSVQGNGTIQAGAAGLTVTNNIAIGPGLTATIDNNGNNFTLGGILSQGGGLTKIGNGVLALTNNNIYSGNTGVNGGTLSLSADANVANSQNIILNGGSLLGNGTFQLSGFHAIGVGPTTGAVGTNALIDAASGQVFEVVGAIGSAGNGGANGLTVNSGPSNDGTLMLGGANTFNGTTVIAKGTLQLANPQALQNSTLNYNSGNLVFDSSINAATLGSLSGSNSLALTNLSGGLVALTLGNNNADATYFGNLFDAGLGSSLIKAGSGTVTLAGTNAYAGTTSANTGTLAVNSGSLTTSNTLTINGGTLHLTNGSITIPNLDLGISTAAGTVNVDSGTASFGITRISSGSINGGAININGGTVSFVTLTDRRDSSVNNGPQAGVGVTINGGSVTVSNLFISTGNSAANLHLTGGSLTIGDSTTTGGFTVGSGTSGSRGGFVTQTGGSLTYLGTDGVLLATTTSVGNWGVLTVNSNAVANLTGVTVNAGNTAGVNSSLTVDNGGTVYVGAVGLVVNQPSSQSFISLGQSKVGALTDWASVAPLTLTSSAIFQAADAGNVAHNISLSGVLSGVGGVTKTGSGTLTLSGANTYTGNTTVSVGTLALQQPTLSSNSTVSVASGAVLHLDFSGTNQVAALVLNGVSKTNGVYGSSTPGGYLAGTGFLRVLAIGPTAPGSITNHLVGNQLSLTWPAGQGWRLQTATTLAPPNWTYVTDGSISSTNITVDPTKPSMFYRLTFP